jgi:hypothetical protein
MTYAHGGAGKFGEGKICAGSDDWSVVLGIRYLRWLSRQLPEWSFVSVDDDGDYVLAKHILLVDGKLDFDILATEMNLSACAI